jgi:hypothetical protein
MILNMKKLDEIDPDVFLATVLTIAENPEALGALHDQALQRLAEVRLSPEGMEERRQSLIKIDIIMRRLELVDMTNIFEVVSWLLDFLAIVPNSVHMTDEQLDRVVECFLDAGFEPGAHEGRRDLDTQMMPLAEYTIGQFLGCIRFQGRLSISTNKLTKRFLQEWVEKFEREAVV